MLLVTLSLAVLLLALAAGLRGTCVQLLAEHWQRQLATLPEAEAGMLVQRAARLGEAGIPVLVEALATSRPSVARAGRQTLLDEVSRWKALPASDTSPRLAILAAAMAERADRFSAEVQPDVAALAGQILLWPLDESKADRAEVIGCCQRVLRATRGERLPPAGPQLAAGEGGGFRSDAPKTADSGVGEAAGPLADDDPRKTGIPLPGPSDVPGGGLPDKMTQPELLPADGVVARLAAARAGGLSASEGAESEESSPLEKGPQHAEPPESSQGSHPIQGPALHPLAYLRAAMQAGDNGPAKPVEAGRWDGVETFDVIRALDSPDSSQADATRRELERRGFTPVHFEIARQLLDRDPAVRIRLARRLPTLTSIDAAPWLLRLSGDPDPGVRQAAIGILATTGDPELLARLERLAGRDPAPCVQRLADEIAKRRKASLR
jgi:hypothetical protein